MKNTLIKFVGISICLLTLNANAGLIYLEESEKTNDFITVNLMGSDFTQGLDIGSFFASWDNSVLEYVDISFNETLYDLVNYVGYVDQSSGYLDDALFSSWGINPLITSTDFTIATITFAILATGTSYIDIAQGWDLGGPSPYYNADYNEIEVSNDVAFNGINVDVSVPEPSTLAIFALGMFGLMSRRLIKKT
ncbi:MAG: PEP-CTERM sorting domain-containing protein [Colwellia sp.]|nr:PEP-CTERM sorting domain-containing protein [Colwellia sp.]